MEFAERKVFTFFNDLRFCKQHLGSLCLLWSGSKAQSKPGHSNRLLKVRISSSQFHFQAIQPLESLKQLPFLRPEIEECWLQCHSGLRQLQTLDTSVMLHPVPY